MAKARVLHPQIFRRFQHFLICFRLFHKLLKKLFPRRAINSEWGLKAEEISAKPNFLTKKRFRMTFNNHALGRDTWIPLSLYFLENIFEYRWIIIVCNLCYLRRRKKSLWNFRKFISQERSIRFFIWSTYWLYLNLFFD